MISSEIRRNGTLGDVSTDRFRLPLQGSRFAESQPQTFANNPVFLAGFYFSDLQAGNTCLSYCAPFSCRVLASKYTKDTKDKDKDQRLPPNRSPRWHTKSRRTAKASGCHENNLIKASSFTEAIRRRLNSCQAILQRQIRWPTDCRTE